jgi:hypothetical protein
LISPPIIIIVFAALVIGCIIVASSAGNWRRRQRIVATPTTPIAQCSGDSVVEIKGKVVASEQGSFKTPFSGRDAVFCRITVQERRSNGKSSYWATIIEEIDARDFHVEDGSGQQARISPRGANTVLDKQSVASSGMFNDPPPQLVSFLTSRGISSETWVGTNKSMQYLEEVLAPGDSLYAIGPSHREAGPPQPDAYRNSPGSLLVMSGMGEGDLELLISNKSEDDLVKNLGTGMTIGFVLIGGSVVAAVLGAVAVMIR